MSLLDTLRSTGELSQLKNEFPPSDTSTVLTCGERVNTWQDLQNSAAEDQLPPTSLAPVPPV